MDPSPLDQPDDSVAVNSNVLVSTVYTTVFPTLNGASRDDDDAVQPTPVLPPQYITSKLPGEEEGTSTQHT